MMKKIGRYKGSQRQKQDMLWFQKELLNWIAFGKRAMQKWPDNDEIKQHTESLIASYLEEKRKL